MQASKRQKVDPQAFFVLEVYMQWLDSNTHIHVSLIRSTCRTLHSKLRTNLAGITLENLEQYEELGADRYELCPVAIRNRDFEFVRSVLGNLTITTNLMRKIQNACVDIDDVEMLKKLQVWSKETAQAFDFGRYLISYAGECSAFSIIDLIQFPGSESHLYENPSIETVEKYPPRYHYSWEGVTRVIIQRNDASQFKRLIELPAYPTEILERLLPAILKADNVEIAKLWCTITGLKLNLAYAYMIQLNIFRWLVEIETPLLQTYSDFAQLALKKDVILYEQIWKGEIDKRNARLAYLALKIGYKTLEDLKDGLYEFSSLWICQAIRQNFNLETIQWMYSRCKPEEREPSAWWMEAVALPTYILMEWVLGLVPEGERMNLWTYMQETTFENALWFYERQPEGLELMLQESNFPDSAVTLWALAQFPIYAYFVYHRASIYKNWELAKSIHEKYSPAGKKPYMSPLCVSDVEVLTWLVKKKLYRFNTLWECVVHADNSDRLDLVEILFSCEEAFLTESYLRHARNCFTERVYRWIVAQQFK